MLTTLSLQSFRSYNKQTFEFSEKSTVIMGPNTTGKTNLLEALFLLATGKSFHAEKDTDMVGWGNELARIKSQISSPNDQFNLEIVITTGEVAGQKEPIKRFFVSGVARRQLDFVGKLKAVLFWPEDLDIVTHSPSYRRRYLDFVLSQTDREYRRSLYSYEKGLRQRNRVLVDIREEGVSRAQLIFWDQLLIKTGNYISRKREAFIEAINQSDRPFGDFSIEYDHSYISSVRLEQYKEEEVAAGVTLVGPHRDDLEFFEKKRDLAHFGSRGEQRLTILWLKLAELDYIEMMTGERPLLLLDDIFSELDHSHREEVVKIADLQQTIVTSTDIHFLPESFRNNAEMIELKNDGI